MNEADRPIGLVDASGSLTYRELNAEIDRAVARLHGLGIGPGDRVGLLGANHRGWAILAHAIPRTGAVLVPLNDRLAPSEIEEQCARAKLACLIRDPAPTELPSAITFDAFARLPPGLPEPSPRLDPDRDAAILFTSGSSRRPKGVVLSARALAASAEAVAGATGLRREDRWLAVLPFSHAGGLGILYRCARAGAAVVLADRFDPGAILEAVPRQRITIVSLVAVMLRRLLRSAGEGGLPAPLRAAIVGGGPVADDLIAACPIARKTYGLTETASMVSLVPEGADEEERKSSGRPLAGIGVRIVSESGQILPADAEGIVEVRGPVLMTRYLDEEKGSRPPVRDGWLRTSDTGRIDGAGRLHPLGRLDDRIIRGGENVSPAEVEAALLEHPSVAEAVVVGIPDPEWGEVPAAMVRPSGAAVDPAALSAHLEGRLARFQIPSRIAPVPEIPSLASGKPDRVRIRELLSSPSPR